MRIEVQSVLGIRKPTQAFTLPEVLVALTVTSILFVSLYVGVATGFGIIQVLRENVRATQIIQERLEICRLYSWSQVTDPNFVPSTFQDYYDPNSPTNSVLIYQGTINVTNSPLSESYSNDLKMVVVTLTWRSGDVQRQRQMTTFVSHHGMQNYIY